MKPEEFVKWLQGRMEHTRQCMASVDKTKDLAKLTMYGGKLRGYKDILDYYTKHAITHKFQ